MLDPHTRGPFYNTFGARFERRQLRLATARDVLGLLVMIALIVAGLNRLDTPNSPIGDALKNLGGLVLVVVAASWIGCKIAGRYFPLGPRSRER